MTRRFSGCVLLALLSFGGPLAFAQAPEPIPDDRRIPVGKPVPRVRDVLPEQKDAVPDNKPPPATKPLTNREAVDALTPADLSHFLPLLKEHYIVGSKLTDEEISRATVQGVLERVAPGARILEAPAITAAEASPFRSETVNGNVGYLRLGAISPANISELDATLQKFAAAPPTALVIDLRATPAGSEFERAAEVCRRFCPKGKVLFSVKKPNVRQELILTSKEEPRYRGLLVVLVDRDAAGAAEVVAAVLRAHVNAMVIGQTTKGEAVEFSDLPLPSGRVLRIAVAEVALPENVTVFPGGVKPDLAVEVSRETNEAVLKAGLEKGVSELVTETERLKMNEAALVAGTNPELEAYQLAQRARGEKVKPPLRDVVLQRALDFITTISIYESKPGRGK